MSLTVAGTKRAGVVIMFGSPVWDKDVSVLEEIGTTGTSKTMEKDAKRGLMPMLLVQKVDHYKVLL